MKNLVDAQSLYAITTELQLKITVTYEENYQKGLTIPVDTRCRLKVDTTSYDVVRRHNDVETTSCVYAVLDNPCNLLIPRRKVSL